MTALLSEGFVDTYRGIGAALRLFWPILLILLLAYSLVYLLTHLAKTASAIENPLAGIALIIGIFAMLIYLLFVLCQGAVGWHRKFLLNETAGWISPIPGRRAFKYSLAVLAFIVVFLIGHLLISSYTLPYLHARFASSIQSTDFTNPERLEAWHRAVRPIQAATFTTAVILVSIILWLGRSWLLAFPHISIRTAPPPFGLFREGLKLPAGLVGALVLVYFLPSFLGLIYYLIVPMKVQLLPGPVILSAIIQLILSAFCFLWGLSILSGAYAKAVAGKAPHEEIGDGAQI